MKHRSFTAVCAHYFGIITTLFINGLIALLPLTLTIVVFSLCFKLLKGWVEPVHNIMPIALQKIPHSDIILVILTIIGLGLILRAFILQPIIHWVEKLIAKIPLVRPIYSGIKQLVHAFNPQDTLTFKKVVLLEFPRKGLYSIGFVTSEIPQELKPDENQLFYSVFVPTTPNPTTGFFMVVPAHEVTVIDLTRQEAMALIISGGIIQPERFTQRQ